MIKPHFHIIVLLTLIIQQPLNAQWSSDPYVNDTVIVLTGAQTSCYIASDGAGGAIYAWHDNREGPMDVNIYAQRIDKNGVLKWDSDGVIICNAINGQLVPRIISDGTGGAIITWYDDRSGNFNIYAQKIDTNGITQWTDNGVLICNAPGLQSEQIIVTDGNGGAFISWDDNRDGNTDLYAQWVDSSGIIHWGISGTPVCVLPYFQGRPTLVMDGTGGIVISWIDQRNPSQDIYAQRILPDGTSAWDVNGVVVCNAIGTQSAPAIVSDTNAYFIVTWPDIRTGVVNLYGQKITDLGTMEWPINGINFTNDTYEESPLGSVSDCAGGVLCVYQDNEIDPTAFYITRINPAGFEEWGENGVLLQAAPGNQNQLRISSDQKGGAVVVWEDDRNGPSNLDLYAQAVDDTGNTLWGTNGVPISLAADKQAWPELIADSTSNCAIFTWWDWRYDPLPGDQNSDIFTAKIGCDGVLLSTTNINLEGVYRDHQVLLNWKLITELQPLYFIVETRSSNGDFTAIDSVSANDLLIEDGYYQYIDDNISSLTLYYRVSALLDAGIAINSNILPINTVDNNFYVHENPVKQFLGITALISNHSAKYSIYALDGNLVLYGKILSGYNSIDVSSVPFGVFILKVESAGKNFEFVISKI